jgi:hypothetical protein
MTNRNQKAHQNSKRPARVPLSAGNKLHVPESIKEEGYQYYWGLDRKGMIEQMEAAWWEKVKDERGEPLTVPAGGGESHYLMRIEQKYYDEDMEKQQQLNIDATAKQAQALGEDEYVPMGKTSVTEREII